MPLYIFCGDFLFCAQLYLPMAVQRIMGRVRGPARFPRTHPHGMKASTLTQEIVDSERTFSDFVQEHCATIYQHQWYGGNGACRRIAWLCDQYCRLLGIDGLRVVGASANIPCIIICERVAAWSKPSSEELMRLISVLLIVAIVLPLVRSRGDGFQSRPGLAQRRAIRCA